MASDTDVYCYLKKSLPRGYAIEAYPSPAYFSEWHFCYRVTHDDRVIAEWVGDFRALEPGTLVAKARDLLASLE